MSKVLITCDEATTICNKNQYNEATFWEKIKLSLHIWGCKFCGRFSKQNGIMTKACDKHLVKSELENKLSLEEKDKLKQKISEFDK